MNAPTPPDLSELDLASLRHLAVLRCPADVHQAIRARIQEIETPYEAVDAAVGLTRGHTSKICAPVPLKGIGLQTLFLMAPELGTAIVMVDVGNANPALRKRLLPLPMPRMRRIRRPKWLLTAKKARKLNELRMQKVSPKRRIAAAKKAAKARWAGKRFKLGRH